MAAFKIHDGADTFQLYGDLPTGIRQTFLKQARGPMIGLLPQDPMGALDPMLNIHRQVRDVIRLTDRKGTETEVLMHSAAQASKTQAELHAIIPTN